MASWPLPALPISVVLRGVNLDLQRNLHLYRTTIRVSGAALSSPLLMIRTVYCATSAGDLTTQPAPPRRLAAHPCSASGLDRLVSRSAADPYRTGRPAGRSFVLEREGDGGGSMPMTRICQPLRNPPPGRSNLTDIPLANITNKCPHRGGRQSWPTRAGQFLALASDLSLHLCRARRVQRLAGACCVTRR